MSAFRRIVQRLRVDPKEAGEPLYRLAVIRMQCRCIADRPLVVDYAVCEDRPLVFLQHVTMLG